MENLPASHHDVVIAGGGPTGLMLAAELALAQVNVAIVERRESQELAGLRAGGLYPRTLELFDQRGIADRFLLKGQTIPSAPFADSQLDMSDLATRHNYFLALWQIHIEGILLDWVNQLAVPIYRGRDVTGFAQHATAVDVELAGGPALRAKYLVGCDGGRSLIRKQAGIDFPGWDPSTSYLIAEIETAQEPVWGIKRGEGGINAIAKLDDGRRARVVINEPRIHQGDTPGFCDVRDALTSVYGTDYGLRSVAHVSRFTDMARQAVSYRDRRVFLAGDAAHVHSPVGGQGLNLGIQDAVNLGWKLAQVVHGTSPDSLLDSYHFERHPIGARVLRNTMALTALHRGEDRVAALRELITEMLQAGAARKRYLAMMSGLDVQYGSGGDHSLQGRRIPNLDLVTATGPLPLFSFLRNAQPVLLNLGEPGLYDNMPLAPRVQRIDATCNGPWELPGIGMVEAPSAVLIRPDGHVAWVENGTRKNLTETITAWFGTPVAPSRSTDPSRGVRGGT